MNKKKKNQKKNKNQKERKISLPSEVKKILTGIFILIFSIFFFLSFFEKGGILGKILISIFKKIFGEKFLLFLPFILILISLPIFFSPYKNISFALFVSFFLLVFGLSGFFEASKEGGGILGKFFYFIFSKLAGEFFAKVLFFLSILIGFSLIYFLIKREKKEAEIIKPSLLKRFFSLSFKSEKILPPIKEEITLPQKEKVILSPPKIEFPKIKYQSPPLSFLEKEEENPFPGDIERGSLIIKKTLESFGIPVEIGEINVGPTVTQYTIKPAQGIKLSKITALSNDLALALAAHPVRIEAPIPGKSLVGIEVPNKIRSFVRLRELISLPEFQQSPSPLTFPLGKDVAGNPVFSDLAKLPHLLVSGATGTGKTIFLNSLILSLVYRNSPQILNFILVDPKRVEFPVYNDLPHLICDVILDPQKTINALRWLLEEMERRFSILANHKTRDIISYNNLASKNSKMELMPYIVLIIDELADLMAARGREIEAAIVRLAQMARAVGIHLVLATQRPSTEVITGLIKANITARIAFQVASQFDSRTILDSGGAEKLLGMGDMLYLSAETIKPKRIQGSFVSEKEVKKIVEFLAQNNPSQKQKIETLTQRLSEEFGEINFVFKEEFQDTDDPLYEEAKRIVIEAKKASASLLQRRLKIGYARAARLLDLLEERGIVGPAQGSKPREVYIEKENDWQKI